MRKDLQQEKLVCTDSRVLFVDEGSRDGNWQQMKQANATDPVVYGVKLARHAGHQKACLQVLCMRRSMWSI